MDIKEIFKNGWDHMRDFEARLLVDRDGNFNVGLTIAVKKEFIK